MKTAFQRCKVGLIIACELEIQSWKEKKEQIPGVLTASRWKIIHLILRQVNDF